MRPEWHIVGLDRDPECLRRAELARRRLELSNVAFVRSDFGEFRAARGFDVVLSVCSAHYLVEAGRGTELFEWFRACLRPGGRLILYGPRRSSEAPFTSWLPRFSWHPVFSASELRELCRGSRLVVSGLESRIGRPGTMAKQLDALAHRGPRRFLLVAGLYPLEWLCQVIDVLRSRPDASASLMWLLVAHLDDEGPSAPPQGIMPGRQQ
jgi:SAM-dependent methyltransferase